MSVACLLCHGETASVPHEQPVTAGLCPACARLMTLSGERFALRALVENIAAPAMLMRGNPRRVFMANARALCLFGKDRAGVEERSGGEVFGCANAFTEQGCGKDPGCDGCRVKEAVVAALERGIAATGISATLPVVARDTTRAHELVVSTESVGELALLRIDRFRPL